MRATKKQISYFKYVLESEGLDLGEYSSKDAESLSHKEIKGILDKVGVPVSPNLEDYKYIMDYGDQQLGYIVGRQLSLKKRTEMKVMCFMDLVVIDWDTPTGVNDVSESGTPTGVNGVNEQGVNDGSPAKRVSAKDGLLENIKAHLSKFPSTFYIYETYNGFHGYIMSERMFYGEYQTIKLMRELNCDRFYVGFTRKVGFVVRIQNKEDRDEQFIERFVCQVNDYPILPELQQLVQIKDSYTTPASVALQKTDVSSNEL